MRRFVLLFILAALGIKTGLDYILSDKFQDWADQKKPPWTCKFNNALGGLFVTASEYKRAHELYRRSAERCPETPMAETAEFELARCLEEMGHRAEAGVAYENFLSKYKDSEKTKVAQRALQIIKGGF